MYLVFFQIKFPDVPIVRYKDFNRPIERTAVFSSQKVPEIAGLSTCARSGQLQLQE